MNRNINRYYNTLFVTYLSVGIGYLLFLILFTIKVIPGFVMQLLFLFDGIMGNQHSLRNLLYDTTFMWAILWGGVAIILLALFIKGFVKSFVLYFNSTTFLNSFKILEEFDDISIIKTSKLEVFTAGLISPRIYISQRLYETLSKSQLKAVLLHERSHLKDYDPLRLLIVRSINFVLPNFVFKKKVLSLYTTVTELKCDIYAEKKLKSKKSLVEALYMIIKSKNVVNDSVFGYFANTPERIPVLLGVQKFHNEVVTALIVLFFSISMVLPFVAANSKFYNCEHVIECINIFIENIGSSKMNGMCKDHSMNDSTLCNLE